MTGIVFENTMGHEVKLVINGKFKAMLDVGESIALDVREGQRVGFIPANEETKTQLAIAAPQVRPANTQLIVGKSERVKTGLRQAAPIDQLDADGNLVHRHPTMKAAAAAISVPWWEMSNHLNKTPEAELKGFRWRRVEEKVAAPRIESEEYVKRQRAGKAVLQSTKSGQALRIWGSQQEAARALGISGSGISKACNGDYPIAGGFRWSFAQVGK